VIEGGIYDNHGELVMWFGDKWHRNLGNTSCTSALNEASLRLISTPIVEKEVRVAQLFHGAGLVSSRSEADRKLKEGACYINAERVVKPLVKLTAGKHELRMGYRTVEVEI
jgi:tyrosyl-tRNA synthetase